MSRKQLETKSLNAENCTALVSGSPIFQKVSSSTNQGDVRLSFDSSNILADFLFFRVGRKDTLVKYIAPYFLPNRFSIYRIDLFKLRYLHLESKLLRIFLSLILILSFLSNFRYPFLQNSSIVVFDRVLNGFLRGSHRICSTKKGVLKNIANFMCFPVNFANF